LVFWLSLLFFADHPAAHGVLTALSLAAVVPTLALLWLRRGGGGRGSADAGGVGVGARMLQLPAEAWPYVIYLQLLTIAWLLRIDAASTLEYQRQLCFLATVLVVGDGLRDRASRGIAIVIVGLALVVVQIL